MTEGLIPNIAQSSSEVAALPEALIPVRPLRTDHGHVVAELGRATLIWFSLIVIYASQHPLSQIALIGLTLAAVVWLVALRSAAMPGQLVLGRAVASSVGTAVGLVVVAALNPWVVGLQLSYPLLLASALAVFVSATVWNWFVEQTLVAKRRVLLVGGDEVDALLTKELRKCPRAPFDVVGSLAGSQELAEIVEAQRPDIVVLTDEATYDVALDRILDARASVRVAGFASFFEYAFGRVPIDQITPAWFMSLLHPRQRIYTRFSKRGFDVLVALLSLVIAAPFLAILALLIKAMGGPVLYRQTRIGEGGRQFTIYKFCTMDCDAEQNGPAFAGDVDPRATRIGCALRRTHVDELPQLWNVLKGEMSIVGPRPERPEFIEMLEAAVPFWSRRLLVKPGITGWAQVRFEYASDWESMAEKLSYDLWYLRHRSLLVDLAVCVMTCTTVLTRPLRS